MQKEEVSGDSIFIIRDFFSEEECRRSIEFSEERVYEDAPIGTRGGEFLAKEVRNNTRVMVDSTALATRLFERARPFLPAQVEFWHLHGFNERFRYYRYDVGQRFRPHYDGSYRRHRGEESQLTFLVYLNDDFGGGTTNFYGDDEKPRASIRPERGAALVFVHAQLHEGAPVTHGRKYVLRTDVMYRFFPAGV